MWIKRANCSNSIFNGHTLTNIYYLPYHHTEVTYHQLLLYMYFFFFFSERVRQIQEKLEEFIHALNAEKWGSNINEDVCLLLPSWSHKLASFISRTVKVLRKDASLKEILTKKCYDLMTTSKLYIVEHFFFY